MAIVTPTPAMLKTLIYDAEGVWFEVFYSGDSHKIIERDGYEYHLLPLRFSTKEKIITFFRRLSTIPRRLKVTSRAATRIRVTAVLSMDRDRDEEILTVRYLIGKSGDKLRILDRNQKDDRFKKYP